MKKIHHCEYETLKKNLQNVYGKNGSTWLSNLPALVDELQKSWKLKNLHPVDNMSFHFVAKAMTVNNLPVVLKIGIDKKIIESEMHALKFFHGQSAIKLIDYNEKYHALLLQQAIPGNSLKSIYAAQCDLVLEVYVRTINKLHRQKLPLDYSFPHSSKWLEIIDKIRSDKIPGALLQHAIQLKNKLLLTSKNEILLHGDLHLDNVLQNDNEWIVIDPKGIIGEKEFEIAAFDFIDASELQNKNLQQLLVARIQSLAQKAQVDFLRLKNWVFVRLILSAAWSIEDHDDPNRAIYLAELLY